MDNFDNQNWDETIQIKERVKKIKIGNWAHGNSRVFSSFDVNSEKFGKQHIKDAGIIVDKDSVQQIKEAVEKLTAKQKAKDRDERHSVHLIVDGTLKLKSLENGETDQFIRLGHLTITDGEETFTFKSKWLEKQEELNRIKDETIEKLDGLLDNIKQEKVEIDINEPEL